MRKLASLLALSGVVFACSSGDTDPATTSASGGSSSPGNGGSGAATASGGGDNGGATPGTGGSTETGGGGAAPSCKLTESGPIEANADGQVIEKLRITSTSGSAITVNGFAHVTIKDCEILHAGGAGISFANADDLTIERVHVVHTGAPAAGQNDSDGRVDIEGQSSNGVVIDHVKLEKGSSGVYLLESPMAKLSFVEGHDFRGPFPRGQVVQFDKSDGATLEDFSCENPPDTSWPEDVVSVYRSSDVTVRRGLIQGNNSTNGVGVMFEESDDAVSGGLCEDVDTVDMGDGSFSGYPARNVTFRNTRARSNHCVSQQGRGLPASNSLVWAGSPDSTNLTITSSIYFDLCNPDNVVWDQDVFTAIDTKKQDFAPRKPNRLTFCWE